MKRALLLLALAAALPQCGCEKAMRNMYEQPKYNTFTASALWPDGRSARPLQPGVVARSAGVLAETSSGQRSGVPPAPPESIVYPRDQRGGTLVAAGTVLAAASTGENLLPITLETLHRGRERYDIYCAPCHSAVGDGDGMVVRRGFPRPLSLHEDKLRLAPDGHLYDVISNGYGVMYPFADRIAVLDRWAIVAYMRALQLSQHARLDDVPPADRAALTGAAK